MLIEATAQNEWAVVEKGLSDWLGVGVGPAPHDRPAWARRLPFHSAVFFSPSLLFNPNWALFDLKLVCRVSDSESWAAQVCGGDSASLERSRNTNSVAVAVKVPSGPCKDVYVEARRPSARRVRGAFMTVRCGKASSPSMHSPKASLMDNVQLWRQDGVCSAGQLDCPSQPPCSLVTQLHLRLTLHWLQLSITAASLLVHLTASTHLSSCWAAVWTNDQHGRPPAFHASRGLIQLHLAGMEARQLTRTVQRSLSHLIITHSPTQILPRNLPSTCLCISVPSFT